jgi:hypothetical protein
LISPPHAQPSQLENILLKSDHSRALGVTPKVRGPANARAWTATRPSDRPRPARATPWLDARPSPPTPTPWPDARPSPPTPTPPARQLADFGLTKILNEADHTVNLDGAGTVTHLAPEMFKAGSKVTKSVDAYAFGEEPRRAPRSRARQDAPGAAPAAARRTFQQSARAP